MAAIETEGVTIEKDVPFGAGGTIKLMCDVYRPDPAASKRTAIVHIHGGAFRGGSKDGARTARPLAALGYTCISTSYRLSQVATWPAQLFDVKACVRWTRANADRLGFDPDKIVVAGYSAGALLAIVAAGSQNRRDLEGQGGNDGVGTELAACVAFYPPPGPANLQAAAGHPVLGPAPTEEDYRSFSPFSHIAAGFPPTILLHGTADTMVPVEASFRFYQALSEAGVKAEMHVIEGVTHIFDAHRALADLSARWIDLFLDRHVVSPRTYPSTEPPSL